MAKKSTQTNSTPLHRSKVKKKGKASKKHSTRKTSKKYKKLYVGQGR